MNNTEDFFKNYRGKYSQYWVERWGLIPELPTSFDNANSIYELVAWLQRAFKNLLEDFQQLEAESEDFKNAIIDLLEYLIPELIRRYSDSEEFRALFIILLEDILAGEERNWLKDLLKEVLEVDMREWIENYLKELYGVQLQAYFSEVANARGKFHDLSSRLSNFEGVVNAKADDFEIRTLLNNIIDGSPKGTFKSLVALRQAHPNGTKGVFITTDNQNWNYWDGSDWVAGGIYQANMSEFSANQVTEGKTNAYLRTTGLAISFDGMWISAKGVAIMDGVNNIWPEDYEGALSASNGFLVYNKTIKKFDMSPIEQFNKDNIILGFFWSDGSGRVNSISRYDVQKNGIWNTYNIHQIKTAVLIGGTDITISNFTFSVTPKVQMDYSGKKVEWEVSNAEITRVDNTISGYILFDSVSKTFILKSIESDLKNEQETVFYVATMWSNGYYTENGVLKNSRKESANAKQIASDSRVVTLGDSITQGLKNYNEPLELFDKSWANYMMKYYGGSLLNLAVSGKTLAGNGADDFNGQASKVNFANFDLAIIAMGVNDFNFQNNIPDMVSGLRRGLDKMFSDNKNLQVAGILPHNLFRLPFTQPANTVYVDGLNFADRNGKTLNDFCDAIAEVYKEYQIPYIDWRKAPVLTLRNYNKWTWDAIHPNELGHALIGRRVAEWLKVNV